MDKDIGEFVRFFLFEGIATNIFGIIMFLAGIFTILFGSYMVIGKKAFNLKSI
ncbi:hypothetical protein [Oceanobacillus sp. FSL K6-0127]|uniref:hypothetical protein n=1 Tax=Oceanobacillus sp. FSL K6-0127 TaxID=2921420 RepID=UPI0030EC940F